MIYRPINRLWRYTPTELRRLGWIILRQETPHVSYVAVKYDDVVNQFFDHQMTSIDPRHAAEWSNLE